jgi:hypothetical protein
MTPRFFASISILAASALCAACTTAGNTDWYSIGTRDGRIGAWPQDDYMQSRFGTSADRAQYLRGWEDGFARRPGPAS